MSDETLPTVSELLAPENVRFVDHVDDWREAIHVSLKALEEGGFVTPEYANNIIADTLSVGPYYVLANNIALIHARPEEGAIKKQLSVTRLAHPIVFKDKAIPLSGMPEWPVRLLFALSAEDPTSHVQVIRVIASICMDDAAVDALLEKENPMELYTAIIEAGNQLED
ncbi:PTS sugar transporter subunit IIA [Atopobium sp. oral taxon 810]|uniref:PTS sugar transporter subunit IIA n=1 Tax=Atopobium sp. oral taxon 810 TaxID=712158 RepID=UPI0003974AFB|nr:PTS sugar transporter subunit IIA [Atopobium sp. oral taxon 810]ERI06401.1 phosphoenolpyruvate-dependent sugar phosphotransferase system, EIIA 2 [Atopobium sp. oral taxon 810 str. F0209]